MGALREPAAPPPDLVVASLRLDAQRLLDGGRYRQAALRFLLAEREARRLGLGPLPWGGLACAYRALWQQTGDRRYLRRYLRYTRERADAQQIGLARRALARVRPRARSARNP